VRLVQDRHHECIRAANFLWLVCPDGYVGPSASMELGYAAAVGVPIFALRHPSDLTLRQYVKIAPSLRAVVEIVGSLPQPERSRGFLIDPRASIEQAHRLLDQVGSVLTDPKSALEPSPLVLRRLMLLRSKLSLPIYAH
jgi:hypothetical protein